MTEHPQGLFFDRMISTAEFIKDSIACDKFISAPLIPPLLRPAAPGRHAWLSTNLVVEAGNGCFDINL